MPTPKGKKLDYSPHEASCKKIGTKRSWKEKLEENVRACIWSFFELIKNLAFEKSCVIYEKKLNKICQLFLFFYLRLSIS